MIRSRLLLLLVLPLLPMLLGARVVELVEQSPIAVPAGMSAEDTTRALKSALLGRKWTLNDESPGRIEATLYIRSHVARVAVTYDASHVNIAYVSSDNLKYREKEGRRYIHRNYLVWIRELAGDMSRALYLIAPQ